MRNSYGNLFVKEFFLHDCLVSRVFTIGFLLGCSVLQLRFANQVQYTMKKNMKQLNDYST